MFSFRRIYACGPGRVKKFLYEERITLYSHVNYDDALRDSDRDSSLYEKECEVFDIGFLESYEGFDGIELSSPISGLEIFSLMRESDLPQMEYVKQYFDTGSERRGKCTE